MPKLLQMKEPCFLMLTASLLLSAQVSQSQIQFENRYTGHPGAEVKGMQQCLDSGYIMVGGQSQSLAIVRTDENGDSLWTYSASTPSQFAFNVEQCLDSNFVVCGYAIESNSSNALMMKLNDQGDTLWTKSYGQSGSHWIQSVKQLADSGFIGVGSRITRMNKHGDELWANNVAAGEQAISMILTSDSHIVYTSTSASLASGGWMTKMDLDGNVSWTKHFSFAHIYNNSDNNLSATSDGGYIVVAQPTDVPATVVIKTDEDGDTLWTRRYPDATLGSGMGVIESDSGGYLVADFNLDASGVHLNLRRLDESGDDMWMKTIDRASAQSLTQCYDRGYAVSGYKESSGKRKFFLWKIGGESLINSTPVVNRIDPKMWPTISIGSFNVTCSECLGQTYQVIDLQGRFVHSGTIESALDFSHLPNGHYVLLTSGEALRFGVFN